MGGYEDGMSAYRFQFELTDGRWWGVGVIADGYDTAKAAARAACPETDAKLVLFGRSSFVYEPIVLDGEITTPRGWTGARNPELLDLEAKE